MNLRYLLLTITLNNINCYNINTQTTSTSNFNNLKSKTTNPVIPARYKITSTMNYGDPTVTQSFPVEYFPEVEYPESVVASSKPYYLSSSPFPNDVQSTFNSLVAKGNSKTKTATDYSWTQNEKNKEKVPATSQKGGKNEITDTKGNEINVIDKGTVETLHQDITMIKNSDNDIDKPFTSWTSTEQSVSTDMDYVVGFISDLSEVMKNFISTETPEYNEPDNNTVHTFESKCSNEFKLSSDITPNNNDSIIELNGNSFIGEEFPERTRNPLCEDSDTNDSVTMLTSLLNECITNVTSVEDMQSDFCSIGLVANENNTSCERSNEFKLSSDMTPNNNDSIIELNGNSFIGEEFPERTRNPLCEDSDTNDSVTMLTSLLNEYIINVTSVEDMQSDFCSIGLVANENNTSCERSNEFKLSSDMTPNSNDSIIELNGNSFVEEKFPERTTNPLCEDSDTNDSVTMLTSLLNECITNVTSVEDMQSDFCSIGLVANENNTSCERSNEFKLSSDMTPNSNDSIIELNGNSFVEEEFPERTRNPLCEDSDTNDSVTMLTSLLNEYITNVTSVEDMQSDFCSIGLVSNETNTSCTAS